MAENRRFGRNDPMKIPAMFHPGFRTSLAIQDGVERNLLITTWGGLGDQICAEPTIRYALREFRDCDISLASERPELFSHLKFKEVFNLKKVRPIYENYLTFETITPPDESNMVWLFFSHMLTNCVDFPSMCAFRLQLPIKDREVLLVPHPAAETPAVPNSIVVHAGKHWPSKTFPKDWWDEVILHLINKGLTPVLIGADTDDNRTTVDVDTIGCIDLRNKLSVLQSVSLLQNSKVLLTNDSAPLHMAVSGDAWIGFIATCKHPDYITHWRKGQWSYKMHNLGLGGIWDLVDNVPNKSEKITVDEIDEATLRTWLPEAEKVAEWAASKVYE
jgi:hypothetical protein